LLQAEVVVCEHWLTFPDIERNPAEPSTLAHDHSVPVFRYHDICGNRIGSIIKTDKNIGPHSFHSLAQGHGGSSLHHGGPSDCRGIESFKPSVIQRQNVIFFRFFHKQFLHIFQFPGIFRRKVIRQAEIFHGIVQFPFIILQYIVRFGAPWGLVNRACKPSVLVYPPVPQHFKVLNSMSFPGCSIIK